jgi:hypothetical protein
MNCLRWQVTVGISMKQGTMLQILLAPQQSKEQEEQSTDEEHVYQANFKVHLFLLFSADSIIYYW